jgi:hypothetical protein
MVERSRAETPGHPRARRGPLLVFGRGLVASVACGVVAGWTVGIAAILLDPRRRTDDRVGWLDVAMDHAGLMLVLVPVRRQIATDPAHRDLALTTGVIAAVAGGAAIRAQWLGLPPGSGWSLTLVAGLAAGTAGALACRWAIPRGSP